METNTGNAKPRESCTQTCSPQPTKQQTLRHCCIHGCPMLTGHQETFPPTFRSQTAISNTKQDPKQGKEDDGAGYFRSIQITNNWLKTPQQHACQCSPSKDQSSNNGDSHDDEQSEQDYTTVYKDDFRIWKTKRPEPFRQTENLKVQYGLGNSDECCNGTPPVSKPVRAGPKPIPIERITSYRADYVSHGVVPRRASMKPPNKPVASHRGGSSKGKSAHKPNQTCPNRGGGLFHQCKALAIEAKFPPSIEGFAQSGCPAEKKPPLMEPKVEMLEGMSFIHDCNVWHAPQCCASARKEKKDGAAKTCKLDKSCQTKRKNSSLHSKSNSPAACDTRCKNVTPPQSGFECSVANRVCWSQCLNVGAKPEGKFSKELTRAQQKICSNLQN